MTKNYYILLLLICFSFSKSLKGITRNLRNLQEKKALSFSEANKLTNDNNVLKFDIILEGTPDLVSDIDYSLTILYKSNKVSATCKYTTDSSTQKLNCQYDCNELYYGMIELPKSSDALSTDTISLQLNSKVTLQQEVELTYEKATIEYISSGTTKYNLQIYVKPAEGQALSDGAFYQVDVSKNGDNIIGNCTFSTDKGYLNCEIKGSNNDLIKLLKDRNNGSIKWKVGDTIEFDKTVLLKFTAGYILGYDIEFNDNDNKWKFNLRESSCNIHKEGYYFSIKVLLNKEGSSNVNALAICTTTNNVYLQTCEIETIIDPENGAQSESDLVYLASSQEGTTFSVTDSSLNVNKIISRKMTLTFVKVYELKFDGSKWHFKIQIDESGLRTGLNVTVDTVWENNDYTQATCTHEDRILSCERVKSQGGQDNELIYLSFVKKYGSITWKDKSEGKEKIPLDAELTIKSSYYLKYENSKWTFKIDANCANHKIPEDSLIVVDISHGGTGKTTANCEKNVEGAKNQIITFSCECLNIPHTDNAESIKLINKEAGSVTLVGYSAPISVARKIEFTFVKAYNLELTYTDSERKWSFDIDFEDPQELNPQNTATFSLDISRPISGGKFTDLKAECQLKKQNTFSCNYKYSNSEIKQYILYIRTTKTVDSKTINWIDGISDTYNQIYLKAELTFLKGTLSYINTKWILNIDVTVPTGSVFLENSKLNIDITKDGEDTTMDCIASTNSLKCDTTQTSQSVGELPSYTLQRVKSDSSSVTWNNEESDSKFYYFYLAANLNFNKAEHLSFESNKWNFNLDVVIPAKNIIKIDILYGDEGSTATCFKENDNVLCTVDNASQNKNNLVKISHIKSSESTITWKNVLEDKNIIADAELNVDSVKHLSYENNNKWEFKMNVIDCDLPLNSAVQIDLQYEGTSKTATCILTSQTVLTCIPDVETQQKTDAFTISSSKSSGSVTYSSVAAKLIISESKTLAFEKVYDLTLNADKWEFKIKLTETNLQNNDSIDIDVKFNGRKKTAECKLQSYILTCTLEKANSSDEIILINNDDNQDLIWSNLNEDIRLYVSYYIKFVNVYGGFYSNQWIFNLKYDSTSNTINAIGNYASLDITVDGRNEKAVCEISQKFLLCASQHSSQNEDEIVKLYGNTNLGTVSFSNIISDSKKTIQPISISLKNEEVNDFAPSGNLITFKIKGNLNGDADSETEIAEKTITGVKIVVTKKAGTKEEQDALCITNAIDDSPVELTCEAKATVKEDEDNVDIKVDTNGKSNYVTFSSVQENIKIYNHEDKKKEEEKNSDEVKATDKNLESKGSNKNSGFIMKTNYIILFLLSLLL